LIKQARDPYALFEIISVVTSGLIAEWVVMSLGGNSKAVGAIPVGLALGLMIFSHHERGETPRSLGFRFDNFWPALRLLLVPTIVAGAVVVLGNLWMRGSEFAIAPLRWRFLTLPLWALFQQYALQGFINTRAQLHFGKGAKSILLAGAVFSLLHFPNPILMVLTMFGGVLWAIVYQRVPNLFAPALSHSLASLLLTLSVSPQLGHGLRVGLKYFR
jgi:membrane protease YdiL (CAAX protease family)